MALETLFKPARPSCGAAACIAHDGEPGGSDREHDAVAIVLIIGASRGIGLETVRAALRAGHSVRALARSVASMPIQNAGLDKVSGNALDSDTIRKTFRDIEVVIQTLGVDISPLAIFERTTLFSQSTRIIVN